MFLNQTIRRSHIHSSKSLYIPKLLQNSLNNYATHLYRIHFDTIYHKKYRYLMRNYMVKIDNKNKIIYLEHPRMNIKIIENDDKFYNIIIEDYFNHQFIRWYGMEKLTNILDEEERNVINDIGKHILSKLNSNF